MTPNQTTAAIARRILDLTLSAKRLDTRALNRLVELGVPHGHQHRLLRLLLRRQRGITTDTVSKLTEEQALRLAWKSRRHFADPSFWNNPYTPKDLLVQLIPNRLLLKPPYRQGEQNLSNVQLTILARKRTTRHLRTLGPRSIGQSAAVAKVLHHATDTANIPDFLWQLTTADAQTLAARLVGLHIDFTPALFTELQDAQGKPDHPFHEAARCTWFSDCIDQIAKLIADLPNVGEAQLRKAEACLSGAVERTIWLPGVALNQHGPALLADRWRNHTRALTSLPVRCLAALFQVDSLAAAAVANDYLDTQLLTSLLEHGLIPAEAIAGLPLDSLLRWSREPAIKSAWPEPQASQGKATG